MTTEREVWACSACRSINQARADRCYRCHVPREVAGVNPTELPTHGATEAYVAPAATGTFKSSETLAVLVSLGVALFILSTFVALWSVWQVSDLRAAGEGEAADRLLGSRTLLLALSPVTGVLALIAYAGWIRQAVANLPPLGLGYSRVSPGMAFIEPLIPGFNVYSLPARAAEVAGKLEEGGRAPILIGLAWFLGVAPLIASAWILRVGRVAETGEDFLRTAGITLLVGFVFQAIALVLGVVVVWHIERLFRERAASIGVAPAAG